VTLADVGQFGASILFIRVDSTGLVALHHALLNIVNSPPDEQATYFEGPSFLPHLTVAHTESGITESELAAMIPLAKTKWTQPISFMANALVMYRALAADSPYKEYQTIPLTGLETLPSA
jgi:2'-5' RNA ligase